MPRDPLPPPSVRVRVAGRIGRFTLDRDRRGGRGVRGADQRVGVVTAALALVHWTCPACDGAGEFWTGPVFEFQTRHDCEVCDSRGWFLLEPDALPTETCPNCRGWGANDHHERCGRCDGLGKI